VISWLVQARIRRPFSLPPPLPHDPRSIRRGGLMTGYGILLTFDSRATLVRRMSPARAKVSSHPHSSRFRYQTQTGRQRERERWGGGREKDGARLMQVPINAPYQWRLQISLCCPFPAPLRIETLKADYRGSSSSRYSPLQSLICAHWYLRMYVRQGTRRDIPEA